MIKKKLTLLLAGSLIAMASVACAGNKGGSLSFTPVVGGYLFDGKQHLDANLVSGARVGYNFTDAFGIEALFDYSHNNESTLGAKPGISMYRYGGELLYHFIPDSRLVPYIAAGYGGVNFDGNSDGISNKRYKKTKGAADYGVGAKLFLAENLALRGDVRHIIYKYDRTYSNFETTVGLYMAFGGTAPAMKPMAPAPVPEPAPAPVVMPLDSDGDGVFDRSDKCPGTPSGVTVDQDGCPFDNDRDGVADYRDKCPSTPARVAVDTDGCPFDTDRDGVADYLDKCPATPAGVAVDMNGCPLDSDRDGVADYLDKCPGTPVGVKVDMNGCPEVVVSAQKAAAAERFCSKPAVLKINFSSDKADIKPEYHDELKTVGDFLVMFPNAKGEISGYTDSTASNAYNQKLSERRAESVQKYINTNFNIESGRVTSKGYGEAKPVASNKTKEGRAKNRRIVANFTCE